MVTTQELLQKKSRHLENGLKDTEISAYLGAVNGWTIEDGKVVKTF